MSKTRPLVDSTSFDLAKHWLGDYVIFSGSADAASDSLEDATWDLADAIQRAVEDWLTDAVESNRLREIQ